MRDPFGIAFFAYYLVMALIGMLIPDDIMSHRWAREFSDFMASVVPQIDRITALNIKPDINRFYFSLQWACSPILFLITCMAVWRGKKMRTAPLWVTPFKNGVLPMFFALFVVVAPLQFTFIIEPGLKLTKLAFGTVLGRGFFSQAFVIGPIFFLPALLAWSLGWATGYIPRLIERERKKNG